MYQYQIKNNKETVELFIFSEDADKIIDEFPLIDEIGYAGYKEKNWLRNLLTNLEVNEKNGNFFNDNKETIKNLIEDAIKKCGSFFNDKRYIFVFPTSDDFIGKNMEGVNGFTSFKKTILIFINPTEKWKENLKEIIIHEMAHTLSGYYGSNEYNLGESIIHEGIAENFRENLTGSKGPWTKVITEYECKKIFEEIKNLLDNKNLSEELFFGIGKYPNWAGYTIGYYLVKDYLNKKFKNKKIDWKNIFKTNTKEILNVWINS